MDTLSAAAHRFLAYLQDHDQIGNRATGDRLSATVVARAAGRRRRRSCCARPYTPMLFMGEEWAASTPWQFFASFPDPGLADAVRTGRRHEFADHGWAAQEVPDPMDPATFERSKLRWAEVGEAGHAEVLATYRALIALRRSHPELSDPRLHRLSVDVDEQRRVITLHRGDLRVICNLGAGELEVAGTVLFASKTPGAPESVTVLAP